MGSDTIGVLPHFAVLVFLQFQDKPDVVILIAGCNMQMEMENRLACNGAVVREDVESFQVKTLDEGGCHHPGCAKERWIALGIEVEEVAVVNSRDDEGVPKMNWIDIKDCDDPVIFEENFRRNFAGNDSTENTIAHCTGAGFQN